MLNFNEKTAYDDKNFDELKDVASACTACGLCETRTNVVFGHGPNPCDVMIVGEGPGQQEDEQGKPFIGKAGQLLTKILESVNISREDEIFITNTVKCRPPQNRDPKPEEIAACKPYLIRQIQLIKPKILLLLGNPSLKSILDDKLSITKARGQWYTAKVDYMDDPLYIMPVFHPSYLLRNASKEQGAPKWLTWQDFKEVRKAMDFYKSVESPA